MEILRGGKTVDTRETILPSRSNPPEEIIDSEVASFLDELKEQSIETGFPSYKVVSASRSFWYDLLRQASTFGLGGKGRLDIPERQLVVTVGVADVRAVNVEDANLDVVWDHLENCLDASGNRINGHPGCEGHCGIGGWPCGVPHASGKRKQPRRRLASKAEISGRVQRGSSG